MDLEKLTEDRGRIDPEHIFVIGGAPRSGTSLVQRFLNNHTAVFAGPEFDLLPSIVDLFDAHMSRIKSQRISKIVSEATVADAFRDLICDLFSEQLNRPGVSYFSEKTPANCLVMSSLSRLMPECKLVVVLRNPEAIERSMAEVASRFKNAGEPVPALIRGANRRVETIAHHQSQAFRAHDTGARIHFIYYEDMIEAPEKTIRELCLFLELEFEEGMLDLKRSIQVPANDSGRWYAADDRLMDLTPKAERLQRRGIRHRGPSAYTRYLLAKHAPYAHPAMARYAPAARPWRLFDPAFLIWEAVLGGKRTWKAMRKRVKKSFQKGSRGLPSKNG